MCRPGFLEVAVRCPMRADTEAHPGGAQGLVAVEARDVVLKAGGFLLTQLPQQDK
jgi:hypothetical protein